MWWIALALVLILFIHFWPKGLWVVISLAALIVGCVLYWNHYQDTLLEKAVFTVQYAPDICPSDKPMRVTIRNTSETNMERVLFTIHARQPGFSSVVTPYTYRQNTSDKILAPDEEYAACYPVPLLARVPEGAPPLDALEWGASADKIFFK